MKANVAGKQALVVSGGAAGAAYGIGVMKALLDGESSATDYTPLDPDIYTGTSAGAFNAAFMVSQPEMTPWVTIRALEHIWVDLLSDSLRTCGNGVYRVRINPLQYLNLQCLVPNPFRPWIQLTRDATFLGRDLLRRGLNFLISSGSVDRRVFEFLDVSQFIDDSSFRQHVHSLIDLEGIRRSEKLLRIIATNWRTGDVAIFGNADMTEELGPGLLTGSAAIPGFFPASYAPGGPYIDGGLIMNVPIKPAIEAGADTLHVTYYDPDVKNLPLTQLVNTLDVLDRSRVIDWATRMNEDIATARWINQGLELLGGLAGGEHLAHEDARIFIRVAAKIEERIRSGHPYRLLTIHRYHPHDDPTGPLGLLNFDRDHLIRLIDRGFTDALGHNCETSGCLLPDRPAVKA